MADSDRPALLLESLVLTVFAYRWTLTDRALADRAFADRVLAWGRMGLPGSD